MMASPSDGDRGEGRTEGGASALLVSGARKRFRETVALDGARLELGVGEVHGLLGENGAGKSTLLGALGGALQLDGGSISVAGREVRIDGPRTAWSLGIGLVHQHFTLVPRLSVLENLALGVRDGSGFRLPLRGIRRRAEDLIDLLDIEVDFDAKVETLGVGEQQRTEILKVLLRDPSVLLLDEPTAVLTPGETGRLLSLLRRLAAEGRAVGVVAHKLDEILQVSDRITVLRRGRTVLEAAISEVDSEVLARAMVGASAPADLLREVRTLSESPPTLAPSASNRVVARLERVSVTGASGAAARLSAVSVEVRSGRVLGVAGVEGNGQHELALVLAGRMEPDEGQAELPDDPGYIPQDRRTEGLVPDFTLVENFALASHRNRSFRRGPFLLWTRIRRRVEEAVARFSVRASSVNAPVASLSGGNQQRVVVARELDRAPSLLVAENPTRGLDVGGTAYVHRRLRELAETDDPPGVVLVSTDLDEILALSDEVSVMVRGRLLPVPREACDRDGIGRMMLSGRDSHPEGDP